ncbi:Outer membrane phospholipase A [Oopsacas minuta]|uniref:Outer membrane phospholipase A n=1 Tax=Oopsacas minuta TaxID=111878 RepID=A0AAV7JFV5_9METZ|nr:Outer membrane phospholipase A [Oopsacas minuta]
MHSYLICVLTILRTEQQTNGEQIHGRNSYVAFEKVEQLIHSTFEEIIRVATKRRDQLLVQLNDKKQNYLKNEQIRQKQLANLEKLIKQLNETSIQQNTIVKVQEEQVKNLEEEKKKYRDPTPILIPTFNTEGLYSLLQQLEKLGRIREDGKMKEELDTPLGLALDREKIYIADSGNNRIQIFSTEGKFVQGFGKGQLCSPYGIALYNEWVFISDWGIDSIFKVSKRNYKFIKSVKGGVSVPRGLTTDTNGEVLVADSFNNRIAVFSGDLKYIIEIGKDKLINPCDVKINNNLIFVADKNEINNIHKFSKSGDLLQSFIKLDDGRDCIFMCFDLYNNILISDCWGS